MTLSRCCGNARVRTILELGYWVLLGDICRHWIVLLFGDIFFSL